MITDYLLPRHKIKSYLIKSIFKLAKLHLFLVSLQSVAETNRYKASTVLNPLMPKDTFVPQ